LPPISIHRVVKVALITGDCPRGHCGVGDYTACLAKALLACGVESRVIAPGDWSLRGVFRVRRSLREQNFDLVHIQYPTVGFGTRLGPQGLALLDPCVVTIHEASQRHILRKLALVPFTVQPEHIIFTSRFERRFATAWAPWIARISSVIPVGSNIDVGTPKGPRARNEIVYFGLIMPGKGLEQVLDLSRLIQSAGLALTVRILGTAPPRCSDYLKRLRSETADLPVLWDIGLNEMQIAERLAGASLAYLPYPDGASERRTTLKAALLNGVAVLTTRAAQTPPDLEAVVRFCPTAEDALAATRHLLGHGDELAGMAAAAVRFGKTCGWERIAELHLRVYQGVLSQRVGQAQIQSDRRQLEAGVGAESNECEPS